jgi:hypothetical protein
MKKSIYAIFISASFIACAEAKENLTDNSIRKEGKEVTLNSATPEKTIESTTEQPTLVKKNETGELTEAEKPQSPNTKTIKVALPEKPISETPAKELVTVNTEIKEQTTQTQKIERTNTTDKETSVTHTSFNTLLTKYVTSEGVVNYKGLKTEQSKLKTYIASLQSNSPNSSWSRNEKLAYWINIYNALTINLLLDNYPIASITKINKAWDTQITTINGKSYTLNDIENKVIRPTFNEPRIHFAVNCGAKSCPKLLNQAFTADKLEGQLQKQTIAFINSTQNKLTVNKVQVSKIFEWYAADFGNIIIFLNKYSKTKINSNAKVSYLEYQWDLNGK